MKEQYKAIGSFGTLGIEIALSILFGSYAGYWADGKLGTSPVFVVLGFGFGCAAAVKSVRRAHREMQEVAKREEREQGNPAPMFDKPGEADRADDEGDQGHGSA
ncbi:MAG TPA: AtpZ/AtpI family protein [Minicystis sp.]|nr:AtpZ/AtpI family protein [Minicystis sp.]